MVCSNPCSLLNLSLRLGLPDANHPPGRGGEGFRSVRLVCHNPPTVQLLQSTVSFALFVTRNTTSSSGLSGAFGATYMVTVSARQRSDQSPGGGVHSHNLCTKTRAFALSMPTKPFASSSLCTPTPHPTLPYAIYNFLHVWPHLVRFPRRLSVFLD